MCLIMSSAYVSRVLAVEVAEDNSVIQVLIFDMRQK